MPEIASFVKELLEEEIFGREYYDRIDDRVCKLNVSQLKAMHKHLSATVDGAKFQVWRDANADIEYHYGDYMMKKVRAVEAADKLKSDIAVKVERKRVLKEDLKGEAARVKIFFETTALETARFEVYEAEKLRQSTERAAILKNAFGLEQKRWRLFSLAAGILLVGVTLPSVLIKNNILMLAIILAAVLSITVLIVLRAFSMTRVRPTTVSKETLEEKIKLRNMDLRFQAENEMLRKEEEFKLAQVVEKEERRKRRKEDKEKKAIEAELLEIERLEKIAAHESQLESRFSLFSAMSVVNARASQLEEGSEYTDCTESEYTPTHGGIHAFGSTNTWGTAFATTTGTHFGGYSEFESGEGLEEEEESTIDGGGGGIKLAPYGSFNTWGSNIANNMSIASTGTRKMGGQQSIVDDDDSEEEVNLDLEAGSVSPLSMTTTRPNG